jgi:hypothetical protein
MHAWLARLTKGIVLVARDHVSDTRRVPLQTSRD